MFSKHNIWETFAEVMASCRSILFAKNNTGIFLQRMSKKTGRAEVRGRRFYPFAAKLRFICTFVAEKSVEFLFGNNHPQFVAAVNHEYDGVAFSEGERRSHSSGRALNMVFSERLIGFILEVMLP